MQDNNEHEKMTSGENAENENNDNADEVGAFGKSTGIDDGESILGKNKVTENYSFDYEDDFEGDNKDDDFIALDDEKNAGEKKTASLLNCFKKLGKTLKKHILPILIFLGVSVIILVALFAYSLSRIDDNRIMKNVYIESVDVGGLTYEEALKKINASYLFNDITITLTSRGQTFQFNGSEIGMTIAPENTVNKALNYCKSDNIIRNGIASFCLNFKAHTILPSTQIETDNLDAKLNEFGNIVLGERKQHYVEYQDNGIMIIRSGNTGYNGDPKIAREQVLKAFENDNYNNIVVSFMTAAPDIMTVESLDALVYKDPVNAHYEINGNDVEIIAGELGRYIDKNEAAEVVGRIFEGCDPVSMNYYTSYPDLTSEMLRQKLFQAKLSTYSTSFAGSTSNRCDNISRAAELINGKVIPAGEVFSFNDTVGKRTIENGFKTAKEYVDGKSVDGIGGGTCQVSSTLYSAVLYADLGIVERLNHMMTVGYIPLGQDATVADGGVDFKFKNTTDYPIKISAFTTGKTLQIDIIGTDWEPHREVKITSTTSTSGENTVVKSTRYVYVNNELISTDTLNSSTYMPHKQEQEQNQE